MVTEEYIEPLLTIFDWENIDDSIYEKASNILILLLFNKENLSIIIEKLKNKISEISFGLGNSILVL